ncbi:MAG: metal ABC transporter substrate-binding protein [Deltaproteobacteria bacterium]|jgi:ABC-type Zn uptake system ZnuABC Zn-binding protein ZnuA|nr:metal ABC transporter substrate-binding protein [Deltaproteobacteria bacterium]
MLLPRLILSALLLPGLLFAPAAAAETRVVAATFPLWLMTRNVARDVPDLRLELLIPAGTGCPHDYALRPRDLLRLSGADLLILNGGGADAFIPRMARGAPAAKTPRILEAAAELEGSLQGNPHFFSSPSLAALLTEKIGAALSAQDPGHAALYTRNAGEYARQMRDLAGKFADLGNRLGRPRILVQHDVFDPLARDAGLAVVGAIQAHEGQEPSAAKLLALREQIRDQGVAAILVEARSPDRAGGILAGEGGIPLVSLDPAAGGPEDAPLDYFSQVMLRNLKALETALGNP